MSAQTLRLAAMFSDHAILQREIPIPVWGWMKPCARVKATLGDSVVQGLSGVDGKFMLRFPPMKAGGAYTLTVESVEDGQKVACEDVWVGEVWLASGQSNMEWKVAALWLDETDCLLTDEIRSIYIPHVVYAGRQSDVQAKWAAADAENLPDMTAVGYFFAKRLQKELGVKIGIVNSSWGGTIIEAWTSRESLSQNPDTLPWLMNYESRINSPEFWAPYNDMDLSNPTNRQDLPVEVEDNPLPADPGNEGVAQGYADVGYADNLWKVMELPGVWNTSEQDISGIFWFRKEIDVPAEWAGKDLELSIGAVDKHDITYFNGSEVGATGKGFEQMHWNQPRNYTVAGNLVKEGKNVIAVRAYSFAYNGGMIGPAKLMHVCPVGQPDVSISLSGEWKYCIEHNFGKINYVQLQDEPGPGVQNSPGILYDNMIAPLVPYALRGAIWYQGESNANDGFAVDCTKYRNAMVSLMRDWRFAWGQGDFPFLQVQLANYQADMDYEEQSMWARLRESQLLSATTEINGGLAVIIDIGEAGDIHPLNKQDVGHRLAQWALAKTYNQNIVPSGPLYKSMSIEGGSIRLYFDHVGQGLNAKGGALKCFVIAGKDKKFKEAEAVIDGSTVVVRNADIDQPLAVRYAWATNPQSCNLYNKDGFPASPFRTDSW